MPLDPTAADAFTAVYERHVSAVYRLCYVYLKNRAEAEDAVQTVFLRYLQAQPALHDANHERAWLLRTAKNCCCDALRSWWRRCRVDADALPEPAAPTGADEPSALRQALLALPERYRVPLYLHYIEGYPTKEVAALLRCPESTVRTRLQRGRDKLRQDLGGNDDGYELTS